MPTYEGMSHRSIRIPSGHCLHYLGKDALLEALPPLLTICTIQKKKVVLEDSNPGASTHGSMLCQVSRNMASYQGIRAHGVTPGYEESVHSYMPPKHY